MPFSIIFSYLYFVKKCGPDFMAHRRPYDVKNVMIVYNVVQILANTYIFIVVRTAGLGNKDLSVRQSLHRWVFMAGICRFRRRSTLFLVFYPGREATCGCRSYIAGRASPWTIG